MEKKDYSDEVRLHRSKIIRFLLFIAGSVSLALGIIGIFTPILPTTPFLLLSAACYARASHRFYNWLMNNRYFGSYIRDWRIHKMIPLGAKIVAISMIFLSIGTTVFFFIPILAVKILISLIGILVVIYLIRIPTKPKD